MFYFLHETILNQKYTKKIFKSIKKIVYAKNDKQI